MAGKKADYILIIITGLLILFGIIVLASASTSVSQIKFGSTYYYFNHQIMFALIPGLILAFIFSKIKLSLIKKWAPIVLLVNMLIMTFVFLPMIGIKVGKAARWISLGIASFQPSEALKLSFILYLATWLEARNKRKLAISKTKKDSKEDFIAFGAILFFVTLLLGLQSDVSTWGVIIATGMIMYFFANTPFWHTIALGAFGIAAIVLLVNIAPYRMQRVKVFLHPDQDPMGIGYQIKQSLIAIGSGGIWGLGFGMSQQKAGLLPHPISDSIFAVLAEETGFAGSVVLIFLFLLFLWRGFNIGKKRQGSFSSLTALGITSWIMLQTMVNIGAMVGVLPLTGIPLPFISHGGSALITELIAVGILLNISKSPKS